MESGNFKDLPPEKRRVGVQVTTQMPGKKTCLEVDEKADGGFFVEKWVGDFFLFAFLPGDEDLLARGFSQEDGPGFLGVKIARGELFPVEEGEGEAVGEHGPEFFHEVEGKPGASGAILVEEADGGVEAGGFEGGPAIVGEKAVEEGKEAVDGIERRTTAAGGEMQGGVVVGGTVDEVLEVEVGGVSLDAS